MRLLLRLAFVALFAFTFCLAKALAAQQPTTGTAISADVYLNTSEGL